MYSVTRSARRVPGSARRYRLKRGNDIISAYSPVGFYHQEAKIMDITKLILVGLINALELERVQ
jgi:hypothetical protein